MSDDDAAAFKALDLDAAVVVSYGHILRKASSTRPVLGCINIHGSLLPRWRGAAPIHRAIVAGDDETASPPCASMRASIFGPMLLAERTPISAADAAETLHDRLAELGATLIVSTLDGLVTESIEANAAARGRRGAARPQARKGEGLLDWRRPAAELRAPVRAFHPLARHVVRAEW